MQTSCAGRLLRAGLLAASLLAATVEAAGEPPRSSEPGEGRAEIFWENLKLRLSEFQKLFRDQSRELDDLREKGVDPREFARIDLDLLVDGGPPKDGIPSIDTPRFDDAGSTPFDDDELVVAVEIDGDARAYPYGILNWHEVVNDTVGGVPVTVSYCPLCDTWLVHERGETTFGVTGKLFQSCLVMYDRADDTLYSQPWAMGIVGPGVNRVLPRRHAVKTTLGRWLRQHPDAKILSAETGYDRDYFGYPYGSYDEDRSILFPVRHRELIRGHPKRIVSYVWEHAEARHPRNRFAGSSVAVGHESVREAGRVEVSFADARAVARWDPDLDTVVFRRPDGTRLVSSTAFAFVYPAFFGEPVEGTAGSEAGKEGAAMIGSGGVAGEDQCPETQRHRTEHASSAPNVAHQCRPPVAQGPIGGEAGGEDGGEEDGAAAEAVGQPSGRWSRAWR